MIAFLIGGSDALEAKGNPSILKMLIVYVIGGLVGGAVAGALSVFATSNTRAALVGVLAVLPLDLTWRVAKEGFTSWGRDDVAMQVIAAIVFGVGGGIITRRITLERSPIGRRRLGE